MRAVFRTVALVHLLGAVIHFSVVRLAGDRLRQGEALPFSAAVLISRAFSVGGLWSPFWVAAGAALGYATEANVVLVFSFGIVLAFIALLLSSLKTLSILDEDRHTFRGYPLSLRVLAVPLAMLLLVFGASIRFPSVPTIKLVLASSVLITCMWALLKWKKGGPRSLAKFALANGASVSGETTLFAGAGLLATGVGALFTTFSFSLPAIGYDPLLPWLCALAMTVLGLLGVHPVVSLSIFGTLGAQLGLDGSSLALSLMAGWGLATTIGPLSAVLIMLQRRFNIPMVALIRANLPFVGIMILLLAPALTLVWALGPSSPM